MPKVTIKGQAQMAATIRAAARNSPREFARALRQEAEVEKKESMRRTPVEYGVLKASHVVIVEEKGNSITATIEVGGASAPYAIHVHENLEALHKVGQAKFLESTLMESRGHMASRVARRIDLNRVVK